MELGLIRGTVQLQPHQPMWQHNARETIAILKKVLGDTAVDIQHIGSTAIGTISAKPIIDLVVGLRDKDEVLAKTDALKAVGVIFRGEDHPGQLLFVMGDFEKDTRTHHIHAVIWNGTEWNNYLNFRDYLNANPDKAQEYDALKRSLAEHFAEERGKYTAGKQTMIDRFLAEALVWRQKQSSVSV